MYIILNMYVHKYTRHQCEESKQYAATMSVVTHIQLVKCRAAENNN